MRLLVSHQLIIQGYMQAGGRVNPLSHYYGIIEKLVGPAQNVCQHLVYIYT